MILKSFESSHKKAATYSGHAYQIVNKGRIEGNSSPFSAVFSRLQEGYCRRLKRDGAIESMIQRVEVWGKLEILSKNVLNEERFRQFICLFHSLQSYSMKGLEK